LGQTPACLAEAIGAVVYFNNDWEAFAPRNASKLREQLDRLNRNDG
jgi:hypothetical protein